MKDNQLLTRHRATLGLRCVFVSLSVLREPIDPALRDREVVDILYAAWIGAKMKQQRALGLFALLMAMGCGDSDDVESGAQIPSMNDAASSAPIDGDVTDGFNNTERRDAGTDASTREVDDALMPSCDSNTIRCTEDGTARLVCSADGMTETIDPCPTDETCVDGDCQDQQCQPDALVCVDGTVRRCDAMGLEVIDEVLDDCAGAGLQCLDGACLDVVEQSRGEVCDNLDCLEARSTELVCQRLLRDLHEVPSQRFESGAAQCDAGQLPQEAYDAALALTNYARWLSGLPEIDYAPTLNPPAQDCATMMSVQGALSHQPDESWACHTRAGAASAGSSNITLMQNRANIEGAIMNFLHDGGDNNRADVGHRRWILSPTLTAMGFGYHHFGNARFAGACQDVISAPAGAPAGPPFIAYPGPGKFPIELIQSRFWRLPWSVHVNRGYGASWASIDRWTIELYRIEGEAETPIEVDYPSASARWYGRSQAIVFTPSTEPSPGRYRVRITGPQGEYEYETELVDCL